MVSITIERYKARPLKFTLARQKAAIALAKTPPMEAVPAMNTPLAIIRVMGMSVKTFL